MNKIILLFLCAFLLVGCLSRQQKCERYVKKYPDCFRHDTTIVHDTTVKIEIKTELKPYLDTNALNKAIDSLKDSCINKVQIKEILKRIPIKVDPYHFENDEYIVNANIKNGVLLVEVEVKERVKEIVVPHPKPKLAQKERTWKEKLIERGTWFLFGAGLLAIVVVLFKGRKRDERYQF